VIIHIKEIEGRKETVPKIKNNKAILSNLLLKNLHWQLYGFCQGSHRTVKKEAFTRDSLAEKKKPVHRKRHIETTNQLS
jgi:hypothetical protein